MEDAVSSQTPGFRAFFQCMRETRLPARPHVRARTRMSAVNPSHAAWISCEKTGFSAPLPGFSGLFAPVFRPMPRFSPRCATQTRLFAPDRAPSARHSALDRTRSPQHTALDRAPSPWHTRPCPGFSPRASRRRAAPGVFLPGLRPGIAPGLGNATPPRRLPGRATPRLCRFAVKKSDPGLTSPLRRGKVLCWGGGGQISRS